MIDKVCHTLQTEYVALLGQRGVGITALINTLVQHGSPLPGMKFLSVTLPGVPNVREFKELFLRHLREAIAVSETELANNISQLRGTADFRVRVALENLGRGTSANHLVIVLNGLTAVPDQPLKNFLQMLREYHEQMRMNYGGQAGEKLRFLIAGDVRLWSLCCDTTPERSPFNIAKCVFLDGLSYEEIQDIDTCGGLETAMKLRDLTGGIPSLIEQATQSSTDTNDLTLFFSYLQDYWYALRPDSQVVLKKIAEGSEQFPLCDPDPKCSEIPEIRSPWMDAFWGGFLRMRHRQLAWRSHVHQAFVMRRANVKYYPSISTIAKVDLRERTERLEKALKYTNYSRNSHEPVQEAQSLASQTYNSELVTLLEMAQHGAKSETIVQEVEQLASLSERDWIKGLAREIAQHKENIDTFLLEAILARANHFLSAQFDVFLCHNGKDKAEVKEIGKQLKSKRILPWLDEWELPPGQPWQRLLEQQIAQVKSAAFFVGPHGIGSWQREELDALLREFNKRGCPVIPVYLMSAPEDMEPPTFLANRTWVDFRKQDPEPMEQLVWGIHGNRDALH
jgi:hypothetical protein